MRTIKKQFEKLRKYSRPSSEFRDELRIRVLEMHEDINGIRTFSWRMVAIPIMTLTVFMATGSGVFAYSSPNVMNDHILYPVKIQLEGLEGRFAITPNRIARYNIKMASRRIAEGEEYIANKRLPQDVIDQTEYYLEHSLYAVTNMESDSEREHMLIRFQIQQDRYNNLFENAHINGILADSMDTILGERNGLGDKMNDIDDGIFISDESIRSEIDAHEERIQDEKYFEDFMRNKLDAMRVQVNESQLRNEEKHILLERITLRETPFMVGDMAENY